MKNYTITVNGNVYEVTVEEGLTTGAPAAAKMPSVPAPSAPAAPAPSAPKQRLHRQHLHRLLL